MPICEVCDDKKSETVACRMCGVHFCSECGYVEKNLCFDCATAEEESDEEAVEDTIEESSGVEEE